MKALIFGVTGQDGHYLREILAAAGITVVGVARHGGEYLMDVSDRGAVEAVIREVHPDYIFQLAAESSVAHQYLWENHAAIGTGTMAILDAVDRHLPECRVLLAGSGLQFVNNSLPLDESTPLDHSSPYAVVRNYSLYAARYFRQRGRKVYFAFLFNHDSPLRTSRHLNMKIAMAAAGSVAGSGEKLRIGDPNAEKEFNFAGDIAAALWCLIRQDQIYEVVTGSGQTYPVHEWLRLCFQHVGLNWKEQVIPDASFQSPYTRLVSNPARLMSLGWRPRVEISQLAAMMMEQAVAQSSTAK